MSTEAKVEPKSEAASTATLNDSTNAAAAPSFPCKSDPNDRYNDDDLESEQMDDEEALLVSLEKEKEEHDLEEAAHPHAQPKAVAEAPRMLQDALQKGLVAASDSEEEENKREEEKKAASPEKSVAGKTESAMEEEKKGDDEHEPHYHARVSDTKCIVFVVINAKSHVMLLFIHTRRQINLTFYCRKLRNIPTLLLETWKSCRQTWQNKRKKQLLQPQLRRKSPRSALRKSKSAKRVQPHSSRHKTRMPRFVREERKQSLCNRQIYQKAVC